MPLRDENKIDITKARELWEQCHGEGGWVKFSISGAHLNSPTKYEQQGDMWFRIYPNHRDDRFSDESTVDNIKALAKWACALKMQITMYAIPDSVGQDKFNYLKVEARRPYMIGYYWMDGMSGLLHDWGCAWNS